MLIKDQKLKFAYIIDQVISVRTETDPHVSVRSYPVSLD